jgi:nucleoid-associated protein EbfC
MKGSMQQLMRQANQMQSRMKKLQEELAQKEYEGSSGGGAVKARIKDNLLISIEIQKEVLDEVEMLQDLVVTATNEALKTAKETSQKEMEKVTGGMSIPGMM